MPKQIPRKALLPALLAATAVLVGCQTAPSSPTDEKAVARAVQMSAEKYCSASIMLGATAEITHDFEIVEA